ncbi:MAG: phosphoribosylpyrophosphate synthetase [Cytophagaceae bacterium]|nr:phosphoribosylpyrophosphate synthetase [Cytophagaceae bacterium]
MHNYDTLSQAVNDLAARGYTENFTLEGNQLTSSKLNLRFNPEDFEIVETHRFEGESDPGDMSVAYAIESKDGVKGVMVNAFGTYASTLSGDMAKKLNQRG